MQMLTREQMDKSGFALYKVVPRFHFVRAVLFKILNAIVTVITLGRCRVVVRNSHWAPIVWDGIIK